MAAYKKGVNKDAFLIYVAIRCKSIFFATIGVTLTGGDYLTCCLF